MGVEGLNCVVTGGSGFVGQRLVEMLIERGANKVVSFDLFAPRHFNRSVSGEKENVNITNHPKVDIVIGDLTNRDQVFKAVEGADCVWHIAALVGPFHEKEMYKKVNYDGTVNIIDACKHHGVGKIVMSSSPSTRFNGKDIEGLREDQLEICKEGEFQQIYAETKAQGELAIRAACCDELLTVCIAPHQVYGPGDSLFMPNILMASKLGQLRLFGKGENYVSFTHVDNYCHGLIIGYDTLYKGSPTLAQFYVVTDGPKQRFWKVIDDACVSFGYQSVFDKFALPVSLLYTVAYFLSVLGWLINVKFRLTPFTVRMMTIHRYFDISNGKRDLNYEPIVSFEQGWNQTIEWMKQNEEWWTKCANGNRR